MTLLNTLRSFLGFGKTKKNRPTRHNYKAKKHYRTKHYRTKHYRSKRVHKMRGG